MDVRKVEINCHNIEEEEERIRMMRESTMKGRGEMCQRKM